jgi:hypothetical protein
MKKLYFLPVITSLVSLALSLMVLKMLFWPIRTIEVKEPIKVENKIVKVGDEVIANLEYNKFIDKKAHVIVQLIDTVSVASTEFDNNLPVGSGEAKIQMFVPKYTPPGKYHLRITAIYKPNELREIQKQFNSEYFEVIK